MVHVDPSRGGELRVEGEAKKASLRGDVDMGGWLDEAPEVEEGVGQELSVLQDSDSPGILLADEQPAVRGEGEERRCRDGGRFGPILEARCYLLGSGREGDPDGEREQDGKRRKADQASSRVDRMEGPLARPDPAASVDRRAFSGPGGIAVVQRSSKA
jgi:hypothetical protein